MTESRERHRPQGEDACLFLPLPPLFHFLLVHLRSSAHGWRRKRRPECQALLGNFQAWEGPSPPLAPEVLGGQGTQELMGKFSDREDMVPRKEAAPGENSITLSMSHVICTIYTPSHRNQTEKYRAPGFKSPLCCVTWGKYPNCSVRCFLNQRVKKVEATYPTDWG